MLQLFAQAAAQVALVAVLLGAGLPVVFALGVRSMVLARSDGHGTPRAPRPVLSAVGILCFLVVLAAVAVGITLIVASGFGLAVSFEHIVPTLVEKA
jgi:hypothetical protein